MGDGRWGTDDPPFQFTRSNLTRLTRPPVISMPSMRPPLRVNASVYGPTNTSVYADLNVRSTPQRDCITSVLSVAEIVYVAPSSSLRYVPAYALSGAPVKSANS